MIKIFFNDEQIVKYLQSKGYIIQKKEDRLKSVEKARQERQEQIKQRIKKAIQEMKEQGIVINANRLSKWAKINYRTAQKYLKEVENVW